jgi:hypothetical protein
VRLEIHGNLDLTVLLARLAILDDEGFQPINAARSM